MASKMIFSSNFHAPKKLTLKSTFFDKPSKNVFVSFLSWLIFKRTHFLTKNMVDAPITVALRICPGCPLLAAQ